jgi:hypothetical protein
MESDLHGWQNIQGQSRGERLRYGFLILHPRLHPTGWRNPTGLLMPSDC